jgi:hypothetical protein
MSASLCKMIKGRISLRQVGILLGIDLPHKDSVKFRSPIRTDRHPSCTIHCNVFTDWSRGEHLDQIDFYAVAKGISRNEGIKELAEILRLVGDAPARPVQRLHVSSADAAERSRKRAAWPIFENPTLEEIRQIAELRGLSPEGVSLAAERGLLFCADSQEGRVWIVTDCSRRNAQARRLDGQIWKRIGVKAWTLPGSEASWPIGIQETQSFSAIALCEGGPDFLSAMHLAWIGGVEDLVAPVALLGASNRIPTDTLRFFAGRRVRIFGHRDKAGREAAERWAGQLVESGCAVSGFLFDGFFKTDGKPVNDLNDFCHLAPEQWETERDRIESAFTFEVPHYARITHQIQ